MGIYGMGKAFNLRYANSGQFRSQHVRFRQPSRPMFGGNVTYTENTNVTIKNGPSGFWGFLGGLFGGLFGGGGMNMGMGMGMGMPMGMGMGMQMGGMSPFGFLNTQMTQPTTQKPGGDRLADLQKMYPDWNITSDGNGKYDAVNKDQTVHHSGNFDEMCQLLLKEKQGAGNTSLKETTDPTSADPTPDPEQKPEQKPDPTPTPTPTPTPSGKKTGGKGLVPEGWYRADTQSNEGKNFDLKSCRSAREVLDKILTAKRDYLSTSDRALLAQELVKANPSVFNLDGTVKPNANFDKLDLPSAKYIDDKYTGKTSFNKAQGTATYTSKKDGKQVTTNSVLTDSGGRTIRGKNGYYVRISASDKKYYDPKGNEISGAAFKEVCPNIYASVNRGVQDE